MVERRIDHGESGGVRADSVVPVLLPAVPEMWDAPLIVEQLADVLESLPELRRPSAQAVRVKFIRYCRDAARVCWPEVSLGQDFAVVKGASGTDLYADIGEALGLNPQQVADACAAAGSDDRY